MRQCCQWVNTSCGIPLPPGKKYVAVQLLTKDTLYCIVEAKERVQHVFKHICAYLGMKSAELFGLALHLDGEFLFLDSSIKLLKLVSKSWKSQSNNGLDSIGRPLLTLHLRIQFFVDCPSLLRDKQTKHHYYIQLRNNYLQHCQAYSEERCFMLTGHALQADLGNYCSSRHRGRYFDPKDYFPSWILNRLGEDYVVLNVPCIHKDNKGVSRSEAEMGFIKEACNPDAPHNLHVYKLKKKKNDLLGSIWLGVCTRGIEIYESGGVNSPTKKLMSTFLWADIRKLCFEKKKFQIVIVSFSEGTRKYTYYTGSDDKSKHLLYLCRSTHQFNLAIQPRIRELQRIESAEEEKQRRNSYRESYIYSDAIDMEWEQEHGPLARGFSNASSPYHRSAKKSTSSSSSRVNVAPIGEVQRTSVISNATSSTTTSGIVSDRVLSLDGSEDEMDMLRESESPQPPKPSLEAINHTLLSVMTIGGANDETVMPMPPSSSSSSYQLTNQNEPHNMTTDVTSSPPMDGEMHAHSSSSERSSTLTAGSCDRSMPNETDVVARQPSECLSDTCSSFDHSYTSSVDSFTNWACRPNHLLPPPPPPPRSFVQSATSLTDDSDWMIDSDLSSSTSLATSVGSTYSTGLMPLTCAAGLLRTKNRLRARGGNHRSNAATAASAQAQFPTHHHHHHHHHYHPIPPQCRTKIGISSLSRNSVSKLPGSSALAMAVAHRQLDTDADQVRPSWHHHSTVTSQSVPNVYVSNGATDDCCLHPCAMATFPPSYRNACFFPERSCPLSCNGHDHGDVKKSAMSVNYAHWSVPNFYVNEMDLLTVGSNGKSDNSTTVTTPPYLVPPPPPYREDSAVSNSRLDDRRIAFSPTWQQRELQRIRGCLPVKAKSEDNILLQEGLCSRLFLNCRKNEASDLSKSSYSPDAVAKTAGLYRSASSVTSGAPLQPTRDQLLDFQKLRERSLHLDLPLITALCNDRSLMAASTSGTFTANAQRVGRGVGRGVGINAGGVRLGNLQDRRRLSYCCSPLPTTTTSTLSSASMSSLNTTRVADNIANGRPFSWHVDTGCSASSTAYPQVTSAINNSTNHLQPPMSVLTSPSSMATSHTNGFSTAVSSCYPLTLVANADAWLAYSQTPPRVSKAGLC